VRATSPPTALRIATAAIALVAAALVPSAVPSTASAERWLRPVPGEVTRPFSYVRASPFLAGAHRGADLAAAPGTVVRAACAGRVMHAGPVADIERVVSVRCGARRVSYLPLARLAVREGATVRAGARIGTVAAGHGGLHLGVRRERDRFGYIDPLALIARPEGPPQPLLPRVGPRPASPRPLSPRPVSPRPARPRPQLARITPASADPVAPTLAPWPAWAGLTLLLAGAAGSGTIALRRRRIARDQLRPVPAE
jgi:murein DD-endopeptidase MepM/ murein hydrolase activator NlpD